MRPKLPQPELSHSCTQPGCGGHGTAGTDPPSGNPPRETFGGRPEIQAGGRWGSLKRPVLWFLAFFGIYASSSVCPFCGAPGCPVGVGGAALVGSVFACLWQYGKNAWEKLIGFLVKSRQ